MPDNETLIADAVALAVIYADASAAYARAEAFRQARPGSRHEPHRTAGRRVARDRAHRRLLEKLHDLEDAGDYLLARIIRVNAHTNASLAETLATREALAALREVA